MTFFTTSSRDYVIHITCTVLVFPMYFLLGTVVSSWSGQSRLIYNLTICTGICRSYPKCGRLAYISGEDFLYRLGTDYRPKTVPYMSSQYSIGQRTVPTAVLCWIFSLKVFRKARIQFNSEKIVLIVILYSWDTENHTRPLQTFWSGKVFLLWQEPNIRFVNSQLQSKVHHASPNKKKCDIQWQCLEVQDTNLYF